MRPVEPRLVPPCVVVSPCTAGSEAAGLRLAWRKNAPILFCNGFDETDYQEGSEAYESSKVLQNALRKLLFCHINLTLDSTVDRFHRLVNPHEL